MKNQKSSIYDGGILFGAVAMGTLYDSLKGFYN